jgi:hypothetical protein
MAKTQLKIISLIVALVLFFIQNHQIQHGGRHFQGNIYDSPTHSLQEKAENIVRSIIHPIR